MSHRSVRFVFAVILSGLATSLYAQGKSNFPDKPVRVIVPLPPGGGTDLLARAVSHGLGDAWGQTIIVDNRGGAGGTIGANLVAKSEPDGYTILLTHLAPISVNPNLSKLPYDPVNDFAAITLATVAPNVIIVHPSLPVAIVKELIALLKAKPGHYTYGTGGNGTSPHLSAELFKLMTGTNMIHVPYKGFGPALVDLISGQISLYFASIPASLPHVRTGKVRPVAVTSLKRTPLMPEMPSIAESGVPGFESIQWYGILAPGKTPASILEKLNKDIVRVLAAPTLKDKLFTMGFEVIANSRQEFAAFVKTDLARWAKVIKEAGIRAE
jgi:tripartite-type tricarboxylate transporter receptor subunit TctC